MPSFQAAFSGSTRERGDNLQGWIVALIVAAFYLVFIVLEAADQRGWRPPPAVLLGIATYPLYLLHAKIGYVAFGIFGQDAQWAVFFGATFLVTVAALITAAIIEPAMRPIWRRSIEWIVSLILRPTKALIPRPASDGHDLAAAIRPAPIDAASPTWVRWSGSPMPTAS
jgi:peptidoglycan/LPS O-acetylase OafA/YrhL